eukprot:m.12793 g.12793  ORF g.12793 m.12793 type:complete len:63 (-) comp17860_c0_seq1:219-407(-)
MAVPASTTANQLISTIADAFPRLHAIKQTLVVAVNQEYVERDEVVQLSAGDELALIPPLSGG